MCYVRAACQHEDSGVLENVEVGIEEVCNEEVSKAVEPLANSSIYQMVTNADGTVSLVGLDASQLDHLLQIQGDWHYILSCDSRQVFFCFWSPLLQCLLLLHQYWKQLQLSLWNFHDRSAFGNSTATMLLNLPVGSCLQWSMGRGLLWSFLPTIIRLEHKFGLKDDILWWLKSFIRGRTHQLAYDVQLSATHQLSWVTEVHFVDDRDSEVVASHGLCLC